MYVNIFTVHVSHCKILWQNTETMTSKTIEYDRVSFHVRWPALHETGQIRTPYTTAPGTLKVGIKAWQLILFWMLSKMSEVQLQPRWTSEFVVRFQESKMATKMAAEKVKITLSMFPGPVSCPKSWYMI